jgi:hypothetical protein
MMNLKPFRHNLDLILVCISVIIMHTPVCLLICLCDTTHMYTYIGKLVMLQLAYEAAAHCTSIVVPYQPAGATTSTPLHGRTMDWESDFLSRMTVDLDFQVGGRTRFMVSYCHYHFVSPMHV